MRSRPPSGTRAHHDVLEFRGSHQPPLRAYRILERGASGRRRLADRSGGILSVLRLNGVVDIAGGDSQLRHAVGVHPDAHGVDLGGAQPRLAHAVHAGQLVQQVDLRVVGEEQRVVAVVRGNQADAGEEGGGDLLDRHSRALHFGRKPRHGEVHAVLRLHRGHVRVGAQLEGHIDAERAVVGAVGHEVEHAIEGEQLFLDGLGDGFFQVLRIAAQIAGADLHHRRDHLGIAGQGKIGDGDGAQDDDHDGDHHRENGMIDEEPRHGLAASPCASACGAGL